MSGLIILAVGCFFGSFLFNFNVGWGDKGAKWIRNILACIGVALLVVSIIGAIVTHSGDVGDTLKSAAYTLVLISFFLGGLALCMRSRCGEKTFRTAFMGAVTLEVIAVILLIVGVIINFTERGTL